MSSDVNIVVQDTLGPTITVLDSAGPSINVISGTPTQSTLAISSLPLPTGAAQDGTDGTGITAPTGGSGIRGWLSGIYSKLASAIAVTQSGTWATGRTWSLSSGTDSVSVSNFPSSQSVTGAFYPAVQPVSLVGDNLPAIPASLTSGVSLASGQSVGISNFPTLQPVSGTLTSARNWNLAANTDSLTAAVSSLPAVSLASGQQVSLAGSNATIPVSIIGGGGGGGGGNGISTVQGFDGTAYRPIKTDTLGNLNVNVISGGGGGGGTASSVTLSGINSGLTLPVSGTLTSGRNWNLAAATDSLTAGLAAGSTLASVGSVSTLPAVSLAAGQTLTAGLAAGSTLASVGTISTLPAVSLAAGQTLTSALAANSTLTAGLAAGSTLASVGTISSLPATLGAITNTAFSSKLQDGAGTALTSTLISGHQALDVNIVAGGGGGGGSSSVTLSGGYGTSSLTPLYDSIVGGTVTLSAGSQVSLAGGIVSGTVNQGATGNAPSTYNSTVQGASAVSIQASNTARKKLCIYNQGAGTLYVLLGSGNPTTSNYTLKVLPNGYFEETTYTGQVNGFFGSAGTALVTEITT